MQVPWGWALQCGPLHPFARHLFTTGDLQLRGPAGGDGAAASQAAHEWGQVADAMGVDAGRLLLVRQVHRDQVAVARRDTAHTWERPEADLIVSDDPESAIGVRVADCAPILMADTRRGAVGAVHAGWRGTVLSAARAGLDSLRLEFGTDPGDVVAAIGPCLGVCCGEVGEEVVAAFRDAGHGDADIARWFMPGPAGRPHLDLPGANRDQLVAAGVRPEHVHVSGLCTRTHAPLLHSYRADRDRAGRMLGAIRAR